MNPELAFFFAWASAGLGAACIAMIIVIVKLRERVIRLESTTSHADPGNSARDLTLHAAIETIASEVERIGESQRFLQKVLFKSEDAGVPLRERSFANLASVDHPITS